MSYCSRSCRRRFTVLYFKSCAYRRIYGHFQQHFTVHAPKRLFMNFFCKFTPDFLLECKISAISWRFPLIFAFYILNVSTSDLFDLLTKNASIPTLIIPTKFEVIWPSAAELQRFCLLIRHVTWWPWPLTFWPWTVVIHGGSRDQPCHQVWRPYDYSFPDPDLPIHYTTSIGLRRRLRVVYSRAVQC